MDKEALDGLGCIENEEYMTGYGQYIASACEAIQQYVLQDKVRKEIPNDLHPLLDGFAAKFKFLSSNHLDISHGLPVLTQSPVRELVCHLERIPMALKEV